MFDKALKIEKRSTMGLVPIKKVDKNALFTPIVTCASPRGSVLSLHPQWCKHSILERSDQNCHVKFDNYILILRMPMPED